MSQKYPIISNEWTIQNNRTFYKKIIVNELKYNTSRIPNEIINYFIQQEDLQYRKFNVLFIFENKNYNSEIYLDNNAEYQIIWNEQLMIKFNNIISGSHMYTENDDISYSYTVKFDKISKYKYHINFHMAPNILSFAPRFISDISLEIGNYYTESQMFSSKSSFEEQEIYNVTKDGNVVNGIYILININNHKSRNKWMKNNTLFSYCYYHYDAMSDNNGYSINYKTIIDFEDKYPIQIFSFDRIKNKYKYYGAFIFLKVEEEDFKRKYFILKSDSKIQQNIKRSKTENLDIETIFKNKRTAVEDKKHNEAIKNTKTQDYSLNDSNIQSNDTDILKKHKHNQNIIKPLDSEMILRNNTDLQKKSDLKQVLLNAEVYRTPVEQIRNSDFEDEEIISFEEGSVKKELHNYHERNKRVIKIAKKNFKVKYGKLFCEVCGFNFEDVYGKLGSDFVEGHHIVPVATLNEGQSTNIDDIVMLCSNCHRMIHRKSPCLTIEELNTIYNNIEI